MEYLKLFSSHTDYENYASGDTMVKPNVSYCEDVKDVHYNPYVPPSRVLTATFHITDTTNPTSITFENGWNGVESVLITKPNGDTFELTYNDLVQYDSVCECGDPYMAYQFDTVGDYVFEYTFNSNTTSLPSDFLSYIPYVTSVDIPNCIIDISDFGGFHNCINLTSVTIPYSVTSIESLVFNGCYFAESNFINNSSLDEVENNYWGATIVDSDIDGLLIKNNEVIKYRGASDNVTIPNSVTSIGNYAFASCTSLTSVTIPNSVTSIGQYTFQSCNSLTSVTIPNSVTNIGNHAFYNCQNLSSVVLPNSITSINSGVFANCINLTSITIPSSVTSIGNIAFQFCSGLTNITIPNSVTSIGQGVFYGCSGLTSVTIGSGVTSIDINAFRNCNSLQSITSLATTAPTIHSTTFQSVKTGGTLYVPSGSNYDTWMLTSNYYLGKYSWTKVEQ